MSARGHRRIQRDAGSHTRTQRDMETTDIHRDTAVIFGHSAQRAASRQMGPQARGGRNEGVPAGSAFDPARYQVQMVKAVEEEISTSQEMDRIIEKVLVPPRRQQQHTQENEHFVKENGKREEIGKREEETARRRTRRPLKKTAREGTG